MSHYFIDQPRSSHKIRPPNIKPGTSPKGTRHATVPHFPTAPSGGYGAPSGGIGHNLNPPRTRGGTPIPGLTYVHRVPGERTRPPATFLNKGWSNGRDDRFAPGDGRDRGPIPHPMQFGSNTGRWNKHLKTQRGEGHFSDHFRSRIGFGDVHECNRGQHFEDGHFEFTLCDRHRRFLANGIAWSVEEAIANAMRFGNSFGPIFDFDRNAFVPANQFMLNPPMLGSGLPVASPYGPTFPPIPQPLPPPPPQPDYFPPAPYNIDTQGNLPVPTPGSEDDGTGTDTGDSGTDTTQQSDQQTGSGGSGGASGVQGILDQVKGHLPIVIIGVGLVALLLIKK